MVAVSIGNASATETIRPRKSILPVEDAEQSRNAEKLTQVKTKSISKTQELTLLILLTVKLR